ncbi:MAG TPA: murein L,D-transpeptidase catalytic domain family protein [Flavipsychrobacter sp.]|nr:murein L,D-transpeptidase catalytic domain family protein [Flavipsychrobacter sp.]
MNFPLRRLFLCVTIASVVLLSGNTVAIEKEKSAVAVNTTENPVTEVYKQIDFSGSESLDYDVFTKAYTGYQNLKAAGKLNTDKNILTVCDYSLSANKNRMWIIDLNAKKVLLNTWVAHGQGTGEEYARHFSNNEGSHQSSMGFYVTGDTYTGKHGNSMYLHGMDEGYNSAAYERAIVVHGAGYVSKDFIAGTGRLGRSWGCPAVSNELSDTVIETIKDGTCMFIYYPEQKYMETCQWLKNCETPTAEMQANTGKL